MVIVLLALCVTDTDGFMVVTLTSIYNTDILAYNLSNESY